MADTGGAGGEAHIGIGKGFQPVNAHAGKLMLLSLDNKWIRRLIAQYFVIELDDFGARRLIPKLKVARHQALLDERLDETDSRDHFERRRMSGRRARTIIDLAFGLEQRYRITLLRARQSRDDADGTSAGDDDANFFHFNVADKLAVGCRELLEAGFFKLSDDTQVHEFFRLVLQDFRPLLRDILISCVVSLHDGARQGEKIFFINVVRCFQQLTIIHSQISAQDP